MSHIILKNYLCNASIRILFRSIVLKSVKYSFLNNIKYNYSIDKSAVALLLNKQLTINPLFDQKRFKQKKSKKAKDEDEDDDDDDNEKNFDETDAKVTKLHVNSMRLDSIVKSSFNLARNKVEVAFYEGRIRKNREKCPKKSITVNIGDEIDLIKNLSPNNSKFLIISRVEICDAQPKKEGLDLQVKRFKNLLIENYTESPWKDVTEKLA